jgi:hypothetical protein
MDAPASQHMGAISAGRSPSLAMLDHIFRYPTIGFSPDRLGNTGSLIGGCEPITARAARDKARSDAPVLVSACRAVRRGRSILGHTWTNFACHVDHPGPFLPLATYLVGMHSAPHKGCCDPDRIWHPSPEKTLARLMTAPLTGCRWEFERRHMTPPSNFALRVIVEGVP